MPDAGYQRSGTLVRRLWMIAAAGLVLAISPLIPAFIGLVFENQYLATYHWLLYFSLPIGLAITVTAGVAALVVSWRGRT